MLRVIEFVADPGPLAAPGDSGSVAVSLAPESKGAVMGIVFAASADLRRALVVPFQAVQTMFGVEVP
jgi:hypothetical protein